MRTSEKSVRVHQIAKVKKRPVECVPGIEENKVEEDEDLVYEQAKTTKKAVSAHRQW